MEDVHNYAEGVRRYAEKIKKMDLNSGNKELLDRFMLDCYSERLSDGRIYKLLYHLVKVSILLNKDFRDASTEDLKSVVRQIETDPRRYTENTKKDFRVAIKKFYKWLNNGEYPKTVTWMKATIKRSERRLPEEFLTEQEVRLLVKAAEGPRNKAFVFVLYESGCRISELLNVKLKHVMFDKYGAQMMVTGKTGGRRVRLIASCDYLRHWLENHPLRNDADSYLWVCLSNNNRGKRLRYHVARYLLQELSTKASITKRVNPHSFRHARATHLANRLTESQLKEFLGWTQSSAQAATYVHLSGKNVDDALLRIHKLKERIDEDVICCPRCKAESNTVSSYCGKCGLPFNIETVMESHEEKMSYEKKMSALLNDASVIKAIEAAWERIEKSRKETSRKF